MFRNLSNVAIALAVAVSACDKTESKTPEPSQGSAAPEPDASVDEAIAAAQSWLALVDNQKYAESWDAAASLFRRAATREDWVSSLNGVRLPLGKLVSRQFRSAEYKTSLPGAPDGKYVVIQFHTAFGNKAQAVETVTPMQEDAATWKVSGYFIR